SPAVPPTRPHARSVRRAVPGTTSSPSARTGSAATWETTVTASELARWALFPPQKSDAPHTRAHAVARTMETTPSVYHDSDREGQCVDRHLRQAGRDH